MTTSQLPDTSLIDAVYQWFDDAEACADSAAPLFANNQWEWKDKDVFIPTRTQILDCLNRLRRDLSEESRWVASGRLAYWPEKGFGHAL